MSVEAIYSLTNTCHLHSKYDIEQKLEDAGIPESVIKQGSSAIEKYASEHKISLPKSDERLAGLSKIQSCRLRR